MLVLKKIKIQLWGAGQIRYLLLITLGLFCLGGFFFFFKNDLPIRPAQATWWNVNWTQRQKLTFNNGGQAENLINFQVLVHLTSSNFNFAAVQPDGDDLRFIDADEDGGAELDYQIEKWTVGDALIWVKVPQINASSSTDYIWLYYSYPSALSGESPGNEVWGGNYRGVWHLDEGSGDIVYDASSNGNNGRLKLTSGWTSSGWIDGAYNFSNLSDYASVTDSLSLDLTDAVTIEAWMNPVGNSDIIGNINPDAVIGSLNICGTHCLPTSILRVTDTIYVVAVDHTQTNDWWMKTVEVSREGEIMRVINTSSTNNDSAQMSKIIHISGDVYAIAYLNVDKGYLKTFTINSQGIFGPIITTYVWDDTPIVNGFDIIHLAGNYYALTYTQTHNGYIQRLTIDQYGQVAGSGGRLRFDDSVQPNPYITPLAGEYYAIVYEGEDMHGLVQTVKIPTPGAISLVDSFAWGGFLSAQSRSHR